ncbi:MAG: immunoglobulin domain-containing protein [Burkholderiaceae bacterium]|jgi:hypothetical protein|nr:immunoglobulin domain-containing protein [Burkholderiaceae bacterium]
MRKRFLSLQWKMALSVWALLLVVCLPAQAASTFDLSSAPGSPISSADYNWDPGTKVLTVNDGADITITGATSDGTRIEVAASATATITLDNASIDLSALPSPTLNESPLLLDAGANVTLTIEGNNLLQGGSRGGALSHAAGIGAPAGTTLTINGTGTLTANGGYSSAGIGGDGTTGTGGDITIDSGTVIAQGGYMGGAGIGGGYGATSRDGGNITINGGTVTATGGMASAGIGGGPSGAGGTITITGGTVTASGDQGLNQGGAGIGGGVSGEGGDITISGGTVKATGSLASAGIGGGILGAGGTITITGEASVTAQGGAGYLAAYGGGAGIGSGGGDTAQPVSAGTIVIDVDTTSTGAVNATGGAAAGTGADIGEGGYLGNNGAGVRSFNGPSPASLTVPVGGTASFTCGETLMTGPASTLTSTWQYSRTNPAGAALWLPSLSSWPPLEPLDPPGITEVSSDSTTLTLAVVKAEMEGYYRCAVMYSGLMNDPNSSILYLSQTAAELNIDRAGATPIPALNPAALALLGLALAGLAGLGRRRG